MKFRFGRHAKRQDRQHINNYRRTILDNQHLHFTTALTDLVKTTTTLDAVNAVSMPDIVNLPDDDSDNQSHTQYDCIHMLDNKTDRRRIFDQSAGRNPFGLSDADTATFYLAHISAHQSQSPELRRATIMTDNGDDNNGKVDNGEGSSDNGKSTCAHTYDRLNAIKTAAQKKYGPARQGARKAKALEKLQSVGPILNPEEATAYRAISARGNDLAQDSGDVS